MEQGHEYGYELMEGLSWDEQLQQRQNLAELDRMMSRDFSPTALFRNPWNDDDEPRRYDQLMQLCSKHIARMPPDVAFGIFQSMFIDSGEISS